MISTFPPGYPMDIFLTLGFTEKCSRAIKNKCKKPPGCLSLQSTVILQISLQYLILLEKYGAKNPVTDEQTKRPIKRPRQLEMRNYVEVKISLRIPRQFYTN